MRTGSLGKSLVVLGAVLATACGGGDEGGSTTTAAPATTVAAAATTTAPRIAIPAADPAAVTRSEKGLLTPADFGGDWVQFQAAGGVLRDINPTSRIGCALPPAGALAVPTVAAVVDGAIV